MFNFKKWWQNLTKQGVPISKKSKTFFWGLLFLIIVSFILTIDFVPRQIDLRVDQVSQIDITAPQTITFIDQEATDKLKEIAAESARKVYEQDVHVNNIIKEKISDFFNEFESENLNYILEEEEAIEEFLFNLNMNYGININKASIITLIQLTEENRKELEKITLEIMDRQLQEQILPQDLAKIKDNLERQAIEKDLTKDSRLALADILKNMVQANTILNQEATLERREEAIAQVEPVKRTVRKDEIIIRKGDVVTEEDIIILEALGLQKPRVNYLNILGFIAIILIITIMGAVYFYKYKQKLWAETKLLVFLELMVIIVLLLARIIEFFQIDLLAYLVPIAMASILTAILINDQTAVVLTIFLSFLLALVFNNNFDIALTAFIGGLVGIFSVKKVSQRSDLIRAGFYVSGILAMLNMALVLSRPGYNWVSVLQYMGLGVLNGLIVAVLANGLLPYLESAFDLSSSVKLLELSNPSQPLLRRLLVEAPGTYHHSVIVGNLAETAADNIGADSLLTRVSAYYHDIGKIKRPYFYIENQYGTENPHDKLTPNLSSLVIKSHVKDGVELARENKLPQKIIDIIKQHHGTNLISFFYQKAQEENKHDTVEKADFSYEGPQAQSKEAAILMLADIVEATLRAKQFNRNNHNRLEGFIREIVREKLTEGQLDNSDLTLQDLNVIVQSFVKVLTGIYHQRIEYPENILKEMKKVDKNDQNRNK